MQTKLLYVFVFLLLGITILVILQKKPREISIPNANILLITIDTIRPDRLSCYGSSNQTPNIDAIARDGILFENAFCQVPLTFPSHTSILTGLFPVHHGVHQNGIEIFQKPDFLISDLFRKNGYKTGAVVSSFVLDRRFGLAGGFDVYEDRMERLPSLSSNFDVERPGNEVLDRGIRILESFGANKWFLWLHFYDPHSPYAPPAPWTGYEGEIAFVDQQIGKLMDWISSKQMQQNLVLVIAGDHGESLGEHGEETHGFFVYNSTLKIPLLLSYPAGPENKKVKAAASAADIVPTLLQLADIKDPMQREGESLLQLMEGEKRSGHIYFESRYAELLGWNGLQGLIRDNWKLIATTRSELYDWQKDKAESTNLYSQQESVSRSLKNTLAKFSQTGTAATQPPDRETLEKLRSLGYVGTTNIAKKPGEADPKDKIAVWSDYEKSLQLKNQGKEVERLEALQSLTNHEPQNNFFRKALASAYREGSDPSMAVLHLEQAIKNDPSDADAYNLLAVTYKELRRYDDALRAAEAAVALEPDRSEFHSVKGIMLVETGMFDEARSEFSRVLKIDPNNAVAWNNLGNALREKGEFPEAVVAYQRAIDLSPHYAYPLNGLATVLIRQDKPTEAIPYLEKAIVLDPKFVEVYLNLGIAYHTIHQTEKAKTLYRTFLKLAPTWMQKEREGAKLLLSQLP